jgi:tyramine---L-glutamate ligase
MRVFVYESITGGGLACEPMPASLAREGGLMLQALAHDLREISGIDLVMTRDCRLPAPDPEAELLWVGDKTDCEAAFRKALQSADAAWPIAPETNGELEALSDSITHAGVKLLACPAPAIKLCASKLRTAERLTGCGVSVVSTMALRHGPEAMADRWVVKPDDGVGCLGARILDGDQLAAMRAGVPAKSRLVVQPYIAGTPASLSLLCASGEARLLSVNLQQIVEENGEFRLTGCAVNAISDIGGVYAKLGSRIAKAMPELWGYVGADIMVTPDGPLVLEINPRLTTSYTGLRLARGVNVARLVLDLANEGMLPEPRFPQDRSIEVRLDE